MGTVERQWSSEISSVCNLISKDLQGFPSKLWVLDYSCENDGGLYAGQSSRKHREGRWPEKYVIIVCEFY